jgi:hypothetical protein
MPTFRLPPARRTALGAMAAACTLATVLGCTDLTEVPRDALTTENAFKNDAEILAGSASVYAQLRQAQWANYNLSEVSSDAQIVPTRGTDWFDNGRWLEIYRHTWTSNSTSALDDLNRQWNDMFNGVAKANLMIDVVNKSSSPSKDANLAELRTLRAWYYYLLMDFFGGVPVVTTTEAQPVARASRDSVFKFIEAELKASRAALPLQGATQYGRVTRHVADAILANLYLNAPVFQGTVTTGGITRAAGRWQEAINHADSVINSGKFNLEPDIRNNFTPTNEGSKENIFVIVNSSVAGLGMSIPQRALHYNSIGIGAWNGFSVLTDVYRSFDPADQRRNVFLVGPQRSLSTGQAITTRAGAPLVIVDTIANPSAANEDEGVRINKFTPAAQVPDGDSHPNDFPFFRLAEMYMIKAEALNELGRTGEAIALINSTIRARAFPTTPRPLAAGLSQAAARQAILTERLYEFTGEAKRRQDLIRIGGYTSPRRFKPNASEPFRVLFPIPSTQLQSNPLLTQNPGY